MQRDGLTRAGQHGRPARARFACAAGRRSRRFVRPHKGDAVSPSLPMNPEFFRALEARRTRAIVERDLEAIEALHAPEYQLITPSGRTYSRTRYLEMIKAAPFYAAWEHGPMEVRVSVDMAVVRYQARITLSSGRVVECWHTDTYELRETVWLAVWSQATELPKAAPAA